MSTWNTKTMTILRRGFVLLTLATVAALPACSTPEDADDPTANDDGPGPGDERSDNGEETTASTESALSGCVHNVGLTIRDGSYVKGSGSMSGCTRVKVWLERRRSSGGGWSVVDTRYCTSSGCAITTLKHCPGSTSYQFRTGVAAQHSGGIWTYTKYSNTLTSGC